MGARVACCDETEDVTERIKSLCGILRTVQLGGGNVVGFQPGAKRGPQHYLVLFNHPFTRSTLCVPVAELTPEIVTEKIYLQPTQARFDFAVESFFGIPIFPKRIYGHLK